MTMIIKKKKKKKEREKRKKNEFWPCDLKFYKTDALPTELARIL